MTTTEQAEIQDVVLEAKQVGAASGEARLVDAWSIDGRGFGTFTVTAQLPAGRVDWDSVVVASFTELLNGRPYFGVAYFELGQIVPSQNRIDFLVRIHWNGPLYFRVNFAILAG